MAESKMNSKPEMNSRNGTESNGRFHNVESIVDRMVNFKMGDSDTDHEANSMNVEESARRAPKLTRNRLNNRNANQNKSGIRFVKDLSV
ncbi:hypothetical protein FSP39_020911 [Pinctada imbricata]|uniref:Uncharacterized protein n=1 Tax=Pinctada imbricata TaxID=66713 RepID=A0AA88YHL3_PINIB|nr:hypothetical protein FSP39_020911 [Pinctada imbricata]